MPASDARVLLRAVSAVLGSDAARGGEQYDPLRRAANVALFGPGAGPGRTRPEYDQRLQQVLGKLRAGLDPALLEALFSQRPGSAVACANAFGVTMGQCDALVAAASREPAALPYTPPDDGSDFAAALRHAHVARALATAIAHHLRAAMLGVPRSLTNDPRGRGLLELLQACPGGLREQEAQLRAWHVGPTVGMARCIAQKLAASGPAAVAAVEQRLGMSATGAVAFLIWGNPSAAPAPAAVAPAPAPTAAPPPAAQAAGWRAQGRRLFGQHRFAEAAAAYGHAAAIDPNDAEAFAGLGASKLELHDGSGAVRAYEQAVRLTPRSSGYFTMLARAFVAVHDRNDAIGALHRALSLDPGNRDAQQGLRALTRAAPPTAPPPAPPPATPPVAPPFAPPPATPPVAPPPAAPTAPPPGATSPPSAAPPAPPNQPSGTPSRQQIIETMRPLEGSLQGCKPDFHGVVTFTIDVVGADGHVKSVTIGDDSPLHGTPEADCMTGIVEGVHFPHFTDDHLDIHYPFDL